MFLSLVPSTLCRSCTSEKCFKGRHLAIVCKKYGQRHWSEGVTSYHVHHLYYHLSLHAPQPP